MQGPFTLCAICGKHHQMQTAPEPLVIPKCVCTACERHRDLRWLVLSAKHKKFEEYAAWHELFRPAGSSYGIMDKAAIESNTFDAVKQTMYDRYLEAGSTARALDQEMISGTAQFNAHKANPVVPMAESFLQEMD